MSLSRCVKKEPSSVLVTGSFWISYDQAEGFGEFQGKHLLEVCFL